MDESASAVGSIRITLKGGEARTYPHGTTGEQIAASISPSLAKKAVAMRVDGVLRDIYLPLESDAAVELVARDDEDALGLIRHDCAHIMAQAAQELHPEVQVTIGPVIENGFYYDFHREEPFRAEDLEAIEERMREIVARATPLRREEWDRAQARLFYERRGEKFKVELVDAIPEGESIGLYRQGDFIDLCRGPHMRTTADAGTAFKLTKVAGSYWRGDHRRERLQRIYGTAWRSRKELDEHLHFLEEAARRDHRNFGRDMGLFHLQDEAPGMVFWHDRGWRMYRLLEEFMRLRLLRRRYQEVRTPQLVSRSLWERSGHWEKFRENMYISENEEGLREFAADPAAPVFALKPMNCPCHVQIYRQGVKSYRDLPLRMSEFGSCHRFEPSGAIHGIMRVRHFVQDDAHIFCTEEQIGPETVEFCSLLREIYRDLGFESVTVKYSDRPEVRAGSDEIWCKAENALRAACEEAKLEYTVNSGEGAFYGPKLEFVLSDAIGREWQCGTLQVDFVLPERLGALYVDSDGERRVPVMLHRAILGSFERFIGIMLEHYAGRLPFWLSPLQCVAATVTSDADAYAFEVRDRLAAAGLRAEADVRNEKIGYKVREHSHAKVPVIAAVGRREVENRTVSLRRLGSNRSDTLALDEAVALLAEQSRPPDSGAHAQHKDGAP